MFFSLFLVLLLQLVLDGCHVTDAGVTEFVDASPRLRYLSVKETDMPPEQSAELESAVANRYRRGQRDPSPVPSPSATSVDDDQQDEDIASVKPPSYSVQELLRIASSPLSRLRPPDMPETPNVTLGAAQTNSAAIDALARKLLSEGKT